MEVCGLGDVVEVCGEGERPVKEDIQTLNQRTGEDGGIVKGGLFANQKFCVIIVKFDEVRSEPGFDNLLVREVAGRVDSALEEM